MEQHYKLSDTAFEEQFHNCSLPPALFTHEAHLRLAWIQLQKYGAEQACDKLCQQIYNYTHKLGATDKFNTTLTIAATKAVYHFTLKEKHQHFPAFIKAFPRLKSHFRELIASHYSFDIFNNEQAKVAYLEPDLLPFD